MLWGVSLSRFTDDRKTWTIDKQFLWGPALLISPALEEVKPTFTL